MPTRCLPAASLRTAYRLPAARVLMWVASYLIYKALWPIWRAISVVGSIFIPALREMLGGGSRSAGQALGAGGDVVEGECHRHAGVRAHQADHVGDALMAETSTALRQRQPDLVRAVPVQDDDPRRHARMSARSTICRNASPSSRLARSRRCDRTHETGGAPKRQPLLRDPRDHRHPRSRFWANSLSRPFSASTNGPFPMSACFFPQRGNRLVRSHRCVLIGQARSVARHLCCPASLGQHQSR